MSESSLVDPARRSTHTELLASRVEAELDRLRTARPALSERIDRAASILVMHLASPPRLRLVRCRIGASGARFLVSSATSGGVVYAVDPRSWGCTCPDFHRRNAACKHGICSWILYKIAREASKCYVCDGRGWVHLGIEVTDETTGEVRKATHSVRGRRCGGPA